MQVDRKLVQRPSNRQNCSVDSKCPLYTSLPLLFWNFSENRAIVVTINRRVKARSKDISSLQLPIVFASKTLSTKRLPLYDVRTRCESTYTYSGNRSNCYHSRKPDVSWFKTRILTPLLRHSHATCAVHHTFIEYVNPSFEIAYQASNHQHIQESLEGMEWEVRVRMLFFGMSLASLYTHHPKIFLILASASATSLTRCFAKFCS